MSMKKGQSADWAVTLFGLGPNMSLLPISYENTVTFICDRTRRKKC